MNSERTRTRKTKIQKNENLVLHTSRCEMQIYIYKPVLNEKMATR